MRLPLTFGALNPANSWVISLRFLTAGGNFFRQESTTGIERRDPPKRDLRPGVSAPDREPGDHGGAAIGHCAIDPFAHHLGFGQ